MTDTGTSLASAGDMYITLGHVLVKFHGGVQLVQYQLHALNQVFFHHILVKQLLTMSISMDKVRS